jgi:hypothetical protein
MSTLCSQNQNNFDDLLVSIETKPDNLNLLLAVCDDNSARDRTIANAKQNLTRRFAVIGRSTKRRTKYATGNRPVSRIRIVFAVTRESCDYSDKRR